MKLRKLLKGIPIQEIKGSQEVDITGVCAHSKGISPGNLFIAKKGRKADGVLFTPEAVAAGASAVLTDFFDPTLKNVTQVIHPNVPTIEGVVAARYHQYPSDHMLMVGVTGTNGKTTTSFAIKHMLETLYGPCGLIGTIEYATGQKQHQAELTTPDVATNHKMLRDMVRAGCRSAVMEVSSHALDQGRVKHIYFDCAIFTNLTQEHLDYHGTMEHYGLAKGQLFQDLDPAHRKKGNFAKAAILNADDPYHLEIAKKCRTKIITFGIERSADVRATDLTLHPNGTHYHLHHQGHCYPVFLPLIGRFNVSNSLACLACGLSQGYSLDRLIAATANLSPVPGRMEQIPNKRGLNIYVDFAHKPDALCNALSCIKEINRGRLIAVFGCGGNRDRTKRAKMAHISETYADLSIVTTDNPRTENPHTIIEEIVKGFHSTSRFRVQPDRRLAIAEAIYLASPGDSVLIAGKGHETYQIFAHHTQDFDDRKIVTQICQEEE